MNSNFTKRLHPISDNYIKKLKEQWYSSKQENPNKEKFTPENQDKLIIYRLRSIRQLDDWLAGKISNDQFMDNLAMEFASFPAPSKSGRSWYDKVGSNKAGISVAAVDDKLTQIATA